MKYGQLPFKLLKCALIWSACTVLNCKNISLIFIELFLINLFVRYWRWIIERYWLRVNWYLRWWLMYGLIVFIMIISLITLRLSRWLTQKTILIEENLLQYANYHTGYQKVLEKQFDLQVRFVLFSSHIKII